jgi:hypothetical protein
LSARLRIVCVCVIVAGCSRPVAKNDGGAADDAATIRRREIASLPEIGDYGPPIDGGRLEAAPPAGWNVLPRGRTYLMGFAKGKPSELPRIIINAGDPPPESPPSLTEDNVTQFAERRDAELRAASQKGAKKINEYNLPLILGNLVYVRHVRQATLGGTPCVVQSLETVQNGRLYTVELIAEIDAARSEDYEPSLTKWRDYGYAVAANLKFVQREQTGEAGGRMKDEG